jgi:hypothetical protein
MVVLMFLPLHLRLPPKTTKNHVVRMLITFLMVSFAWIFFRATSLQDSFYIVTNLFNFNSSQDLLVPFRQSLWLFEAPIELLVSLILITILFTADWISIQQFQWKNIPTPFRWATYYLLLGGILVSQFFLNIGTQQFIYRQF